MSRSPPKRREVISPSKRRKVTTPTATASTATSFPFDCICRCISYVPSTETFLKVATTLNSGLRHFVHTEGYNCGSHLEFVLFSNPRALISSDFADFASQLRFVFRCRVNDERALVLLQHFPNLRSLLFVGNLTTDGHARLSRMASASCLQKLVIWGQLCCGKTDAVFHGFADPRPRISLGKLFGRCFPSLEVLEIADETAKEEGENEERGHSGLGSIARGSKRGKDINEMAILVAMNTEEESEEGGGGRVGGGLPPGLKVLRVFGARFDRELENDREVKSLFGPVVDSLTELTLTSVKLQGGRGGQGGYRSIEGALAMGPGAHSPPLLRLPFSCLRKVRLQGLVAFAEETVRILPRDLEELYIGDVNPFWLSKSTCAAFPPRLRVLCLDHVDIRGGEDEMRFMQGFPPEMRKTLKRLELRCLLSERPSQSLLEGLEELFAGSLESLLLEGMSVLRSGPFHHWPLLKKLTILDGAGLCLESAPMLEELRFSQRAFVGTLEEKFTLTSCSIRGVSEIGYNGGLPCGVEEARLYHPEELRRYSATDIGITKDFLSAATHLEFLSLVRCENVDESLPSCFRELRDLRIDCKTHLNDLSFLQHMTALISLSLHCRRVTGVQLITSWLSASLERLDLANVVCTQVDCVALPFLRRLRLSGVQNIELMLIPSVKFLSLENCSFDSQQLFSVGVVRPEHFASLRQAKVTSCQNSHRLIRFLKSSPFRLDLEVDEASSREPLKYCSCPGCARTQTPEGGKLKSCARCRRAFYCSRRCQVRHWKLGHRGKCSSGEGGHQ